MVSDVLNDLKNETTEAETLRLNLLDIIGDDEIALRDTIEGETDIQELIKLAVQQVSDDQATIAGIKNHKNTLSDRQRRIEGRVDTMRAALASAMTAAVLKTVEAPCGTVTLKAVAPSLIITDEAMIPADYFVPQDPKLDNKTLAADTKAAAKDGGSIPGVTMSNGGMTIQIRTL